ncbi:MAG: hypothetical protein M3Y27_09805 [Acidobacteriota bacterium]|nr:hypothetical protein [Acidobacteriota bacterium]MDQ2946217.1 hypothetical protein [Acidobacteriota bacterium]
MSALAEIQRRVQATVALIEQNERAAIQPGAPSSVFVNIRALEKLRRRLEREFDQLAREEELEVCRYSLLVDAERVTLNSIAAAWQDFQKLLTLTYDAVVNGPRDKGRARAAERDATSFGFGYTFTGSVGVVVTLPSDRLDSHEPSLVAATETLFALAKAKTTEQVSEFARRLGAQPVRAMYKWADIHVQNQLGAGIEWLTPDDRKISLLVQKEELATLRDVIAQTSQSEETILEATGILRAVDTDNHTFKLVTEDEKIVGKYEAAIKNDEIISVNATYTATIRRTTTIQYSTEEVKIVNFLLSIKP